MSASVRGCSSNTWDRDTRGALTKKNGLWVVAPIQADHAGFDIRQQDVLLGFVETVDLVDEKEGGLAGVGEAVGGSGEHPAHLGDIGFDAAQAFEPAAGLAGDDLGERGFARAGWSVKDRGLDAIGFDAGAPEQLSGRQDIFCWPAYSPRFLAACGRPARSGSKGRRGRGLGGPVDCGIARVVRVTGPRRIRRLRWR